VAGVALSFTVSLPFDGTASYYDIDAQFQGSCDITCKIVVSGPYPDQPTTVASGHASGGKSECSAQVAPDGRQGLTWTQES
jgi:hypothetical protein